MEDNRINRIITESINKILTEETKSEKKRNQDDIERAFKKGSKGRSGIKSIVVLTAENPDSKSASQKYNKKANHSLLKDLKGGNYVIVPAIGRFGNDEHPYAVINMSKDTAKYLCGKYQQTSFIYSEFADDGKVMSEYWEKKDSEQPYNSNMNPYVLKDTCEEWEDLNGAEDNFTIIGRKFKYSIPFSIFNEIDDTISENISRMISFKAKHGVPMTRSGILYMLEGVGYAPANYRKAIYKGLLECFKC